MVADGGSQADEPVLLLTDVFEKLDGKDVIEFGSYRGGNALFMAHVLKAVAPDAPDFLELEPGVR